MFSGHQISEKKFNFHIFVISYGRVENNIEQTLFIKKKIYFLFVARISVIVFRYDRQFSYTYFSFLFFFFFGKGVGRRTKQNTEISDSLNSRSLMNPLW
jgi:hypothetical protein